MVKRNPYVGHLHGGYLFPEITRRKNAFLEKHPNAPLISLGIGDTTEPLPSFIAEQLSRAAQKLATREGYSGYGPEEGRLDLRQKISQHFYKGAFSPAEVFISDGINSDIGRLQTLFGHGASLAVQDPTYPVYVDTGVVLGQTAGYDPEQRRYRNVVYLPCHPENDFFPDLSHTPRSDLIYFCSPNNPTGTVATYEQLASLVAFAKENHSLIIFDSAYAAYIQDDSLPRSIYDIPGAEEVAIELGSFSKMAGFTGVRLSWSVVPRALKFEGGESVLNDWTRIHTTFFNGASNIAQEGGLAVLSPEGQQATQAIIRHYMDNASLIKQTLEGRGLTVYGGQHAPFLWAHFPGASSWDTFDHLLQSYHIVTAPGSGFGHKGEGFIRLSAFASRHNTQEACLRLGGRAP